MMTVAELIAELQNLDPAAPVLTSGYEGGYEPAHVGTLEVQELDRQGSDWLGPWEEADEARRLAALDCNPEGVPVLFGEPVVAAVIYRAGR